MKDAINALETSILNRKFVHGGHPVLTWNFSNAIVEMDPAGNRKLDKSKTRFRIDGAVACAMALGLKYKDMMALPQPSQFESMTIEEIRSRMAL
jgi:phage terminase large subunit-like protein